MAESPSAERKRWLAQNQRYLMACIACVHTRLARSGDGPTAPDPGAETALAEQQEAVVASRAALEAPAAIDLLCQRLELSPFERDVLLACAGLELDEKLAADFAASNSNRALCFALLLTALPDAHWSALAPTAGLRRYGLIVFDATHSLVHAPLRLDERVLHHLTGVSFLEPRLRGILTTVAPPHEQPLSLRMLTARAVHRLQSQQVQQGLTLLLCGEHLPTQLEIAASATHEKGWSLYKLDAREVPESREERAALALLVERQCFLQGAALALICTDDLDEQRRHLAATFCQSIEVPVIIIARDPLRDIEAPIIRLRDKAPPLVEQRQLWMSALGELVPRCSEQLDLILGHFQLSPAAIRAIAQATAVELELHPDAEPARLLWSACREHARPRLGELCQRIEPTATWEELILPVAQATTLHAIAGQVRQRLTVYQQWGFGRGDKRGLGISVLFAGLSGTGKTLAAEVLANELQVDLYRIDLSQLVSKYIGETEKNLRRVFDAAEECGAVLLFDEADALFGKRSEVKDSHDRYANIEVSYLLQRMEAYRGLAILTSNIKSALDTAFLRRIRFVVQFPFPDAEQREKLWRRALRPDAPADGLDPLKLARLNVAGGSISNIAMNAAFLAADAGEPLSMTHLLQAARSEYQKLDKSLTDGEIQGWV